MKIKLIELLFWLADRIEALLERFDRCCYPGCESGYYSDVEMCQACFDSMTPEEIAADQKEQAEFEMESLGAEGQK